MPRLLLVDDNPSIHKIAETLLAPTDIQLVCVESAKEALNLIAQGERFDAALLDTSMIGMDGWELLNQLRVHPATAGIPIAMMAGVLDTVDPARLENAPIQGFLKKPVELRDLGERVHKLLETRVEAPPPPAQEFSPFSTLPAVKLSDLPEFRKRPEPTPESEPATAPGMEPQVEALEADILLLTEEDLWPEVPPPPGTVTEDLSPFAEIPPEEPLDLEELDLDSLKGLTIDAGGAAPVLAPAPFDPTQAIEPVSEAIPSSDSFPEAAPSVATEIVEAPGEAFELPDLGGDVEPTFDPSALAGLDSLSDEALEPRPTEQPAPAFDSDPEFLAGLGETSVTPDVAVVDWSDDSEKMLGTLTPSQPLPADRLDAALDAVDAEDELDLGELETLPEPVAVQGFPLAEPELSEVRPPVATAPESPEAALVPPSVGSGASPAAEDLLRAITADPALMDQLAKALVAKLSDQVLREIAWEVMPEMAERFNRH
jgi:CheY-like chemotaxis protein